MKTEVIMKRELLGMEISQKSKSEYFSLTDLVKAGNYWRSSNKISRFDEKAYFRNKSTKEFVQELEKKYGKVKISARGRGHHTWVHPFLFIDVALAISPKLKIETYEWLFDMLIKYRNNSGDSYKKMCGVLWVRTKNKSTFHKKISDLCKLIKIECGVFDWNKATEPQLKKRDRIQENIALLADVLSSPQEAIRIAFDKI